MSANIEAITKLRNQTGAGLLMVKEALAEAKGDEAAALVILRQKGLQMAHNRASKTADQGIIESYIHTGSRTGVLLEVNCETDFVARNETFRTFVRDVALHIAAAKPIYLSREDVPAEVVAHEKAIHENSLTNKPAAIREKIVAGKLENFYATVCLLDQQFVKESTKTIKELLQAQTLSTRENVKIRRFVRFELGS